MRERDVKVGERSLEVWDGGEEHGPAILYHHGTPSCGQLYDNWVQDAQGRGLRLVGYSRPGYGGSTRRQGRDVAQCVEDVTAIADALGIERFSSWGASGGGPHVLACAALLPDRVVAAASLASVAPYDAPGLEFLAGMGEDNIVEFHAALQGEEALTALVDAEVQATRGATMEQMAENMSTVLSAVDRAAYSDEFGAHLMRSGKHALSNGGGGWVDDDLAFTRSWGFALRDIRIPLQIWQGGEDLMVPPAHGAWLAGQLPQAVFMARPEDGHLALATRRISEVHAWLASHF
ncbi:MAG TPA: alpha/beta hydrolase [Candidatus Dormibacteraeota bacterium]|nr:alpha/beta hydrolase [Candidatus Dormibacteraeota bacterium]